MFLTAKLCFVRKAISKWRNTDAAKESKELIRLRKRVDEIENLAELRRLSNRRLKCVGYLMEMKTHVFFHNTTKSKNIKISCMV